MATKAQKQISETVRNLEDEASPNAISFAPERDLANTNLRDKNAMDEQFRTSAYTTKDKQDELMTAKLLLQTAPGVTEFGVLEAKDSDFLWLQKKREQADYANFSNWFAENFDKMDPAQKKLARDMFPTFYQERLEQLHKDVALQGKLAEIKLMGVQNKDDLMLQYAMESGYIEADPLENILHPERSKDAKALVNRKLRYGRGLLNPRRLVRGDYGTTHRYTNADDLISHKMDIRNAQRGDPTQNVGFSSWTGGREQQAGPKEQMDFLRNLL